MSEGARRYKYLDALTTMFVVILLVSNLVAQKICMIGPFAVSGAVLLFPITYIFGDVFTEVYGFSASRRAIWLVIGAPSPFYALYMMSWLDSSYTRSDVPVIEIGAACSLLWGMFGIALLGAAAQRCHRAVRDHDAAVAAAEAALRAEDAALEPAATEAAAAG